jgi:hypothetical protein
MSNRRVPAKDRNNERCKKCRNRAHWLVKTGSRPEDGIVICGWCKWERPLPPNMIPVRP